MSDRAAIYAGSFDPITNGHLWIIQQGSLMFDRLNVAIGENPDKRCMFSLQERLDMIYASTLGYRNIIVGSFSNRYLVDYATEARARFILRGIRSAADYEYERTLRHINADLDSEITTVYLIPPREIAEVSSSVVRGLVGPDGWRDIVSKYVPAPVMQKLEEAHAKTRKEQDGKNT
jgi:pantetheine-phosphate adenylyltransferase